LKILKLFLGIALIILAIAIATVPHFNTCEYHGKFITMMNGATTPMKCSWSAQAEVVVGAGLLTVGILMLASHKKETISFLSIIGIVLGAAVILVPTRVIGVCASLMPCHTFMQPFLAAMGSLTIALCITGLVVSLTSKDSDA
jgi:hypothetical protein